MTESLSASFAAMAKQFKALDRRIRAQVKTWVRYDDICVPCDPEPYRWRRGGFAEAKEAKDGATRCGFDAEGRLVIDVGPGGTEYYVYGPTEIRSFRYERDGAPVVVRSLKLDAQGHVVEKRSKAKGNTLHERLIWKGDRLVRTEQKGTKGWSMMQTLDYDPKGALIRIWRDNPFKPNGKEVRWGKRFPK